MKIIDLEQGTYEWKLARIGIPTASQFHRIITPAKLMLSAQADGYAHELLAEWITGEPNDGPDSPWMERGSEQEDQAIAQYELERGVDVERVGFCTYELERGVDVERVGFCTLDDGWAGCSPDGLVGEDGMVEVKCPSAAKVVGYLLGAGHTPKDEAKYRIQSQGNLWVTGRKWCDRITYCPAMPLHVERVYEDIEITNSIAGAVHEFNLGMAKMRERLEALGVRTYRREICEHGIDVRICRICRGE